MSGSKGGCCAPESDPHDHCGPKNSVDWLLWGSLSIALLAYGAHVLGIAIGSAPSLQHFAHSIYELLNRMWWGIALGIAFVGLLGQVPREFVISLLGQPGTKRGLLRATLAGLMLDLCNHGILLVGMKIYERGASLGQTMAFLIASPWNSFSLTLILWGLIGLEWTIVFVILSAIIALTSGWIFDLLTTKKVLAANPHGIDLPTDFRFIPEAKRILRQKPPTPGKIAKALWNGLLESRMILRWIFFGTVLASVIRAFVDVEFFQNYFGPSLVGMGATLLAAIVIEVCSEGSTPIAADLTLRAKAPGNGFMFLMAGAATDYTEIMMIKETTKRWKTALFLPLVTVPQVLLLSWFLNQ